MTAGAVAAGTAFTSAVLGGCGNPTALPETAKEVRPGADGTPGRGGILYFGLSTDPANFDPHVTTGAASDYLRQLAYNGLLQFDANGEIVGDLAEEYGFSDPRTYVVRLRPDVQFHDGSPLTADDVVFSIQRMQDEATAASSAPLLAGVVEVVARDPRTVELRLAEPDVALPFALALPPTLIVSRRWIESGANPKTSVMGTGPFRFVERIPGVATTYERFDNYFEPDLPYLNGIVFQPMGDDYARVTALRAATVDMIDYVPATHVDVVTRNPQLQFASDKNFGFGYVGFDLAQKPFDGPGHVAVAALDRTRRRSSATGVAHVPTELALDPEFLIADEPTSALDVSVQATVLALLSELQERLGFSCLFISHDLAVIELMSDQVTVLQHGRVVESAAASTVLRSPTSDYTKRLIAAAPVPDPVAQAERRRAWQAMSA